MSYFPCDIPFMSEDEKKKNGIKYNSDVDKDINVPSNDTISRQAALDGLSKLRPRMIDTYEKDGDTFLKVRACDVNDMLEGLPPAQTEIILCKDYVRYGEPECLMAYDGKQWAEADGFCHAGER